MTITQLRYVLAVAEYRNFTKAAEKVFVTQPTLSMQVQKLEDELEVLIFDRSKKPIGLTTIGAKLLEQAQIVLNESTRVHDIVAQEKGLIGGPFKLGIIPTVMPTLLPMFLSALIKKYPLLQLTIEELHTETIIEKLENHHLDAAIAVTPLKQDHIQERVLYYEPFVGYIPKNHRLAEKKRLQIDDLDISDILLLEEGHCFRDAILNLCQARLEKKTTAFQLTSGSFETLIKLADEGLGMTLLPYLHTLDRNKKETALLRQFEAPMPAREVSLVYHKNELKVHIVDALKQTISGIVKGAIAFQNVQIISPIPNKKS